ncbi:protein pygopus [Lucilia cuprina]|uniref:protein pygopus n=1 Tax=Lucilia cuprina TaxID=7375 RepID=UPI001F05A9B0|nr:protein pygopus [Lucilia cuprina]
MGDSTPICRCRVLYLGSAVPRQSKDGLQGIQEPLRSLYPSEGAVGAKGIDSWLSVWSNGILLENVDENLKEITRFFPIESLHYCAAVRQVLIPERGNSNPEPKFLPLDSPFARMPRAQHPPIFAAILRRTTGIKVLECHVFICKREAAANALVRCCFHAYADNSYARQLETGSTGGGAGSSVYGTLKSNMASKSNGDLTSVGLSNGNNHHHHFQQQHLSPSSASHAGWRSRAGSITTLNSVGRQSNGHLMNGGGGDNTSSAAEGYTSVKNFYDSSADLNVAVDDGDASLYNGDANHKVWSGSQDQLDSIVMESPYDMYSGNTSTLGRPARLRQISQPIDVPPPPMKEESKKKKDKKSSKSSSSQSLSGTLIRPKPIHPATLQRHGIPMGPGPGSMIYGALPGPPPQQPPMGRNYHTISHRGFPPGPPLPPHHHPGMPPQMHPQMMHGPPPHHMGVPMQLPVMMPQQYATLQPSTSTKKKKKDKKSTGIPVGMPIVPPIYAYHHAQAMGGPAPPPPQSVMAQSMIGEPRPLAMSSRKLAASMGNGLDDSGNSGAESPGGTGIYRRKGHLNERAFSYSIRQEHRSRSHGSLASLQFNPPDMKKEREIAQMVAGLDLNDGPEDPRSMGPATLQRKQAAMMNGNGAIYGNGGGQAIYGNGPSSSFGKPRR